MLYNLTKELKEFSVGAAQETLIVSVSVTNSLRYFIQVSFICLNEQSGWSLWINGFVAVLDHFFPTAEST